MLNKDAFFRKILKDKTMLAAQIILANFIQTIHKASGTMVYYKDRMKNERSCHNIQHSLTEQTLSSNTSVAIKHDQDPDTFFYDFFLLIS